MKLPNLPILEVVKELKAELARSSSVLTAPPGSGKTTIVPLVLLNENWLKGKNILILEPRRLAAKAAAFRMAALLGEQVGRRVGYQIRFDRLVGPETRIEVITEGILTRRLQNDPELSGVGLVIFDEFHERSIHADLALAFCLDVCQLRPDLKLLVMSATLETEKLAGMMGSVPVIEGKGKYYEVELEYLAYRPTGGIVQTTVAGVERVLRERDGDVLVFLPGQGEIRAAARKLSADVDKDNTIIAPLYGDLRQEQQDRVLKPDPDGRRRIILATSIAETSLTIEGVDCVVDGGWSRRPEFDPGTGLTRLNTIRVSKTAARQRAGRAGRLGPGYCLRLWTKEEHHSLIESHPPEVITADLAGLALELALWGVADPEELHWLDPPRSGPYSQARQLLSAMGAISVRGTITQKGRKLSNLPLHPRLGHMLLEAVTKGEGALASDLAAIISERDILRGRSNSAELGLRLEMLESWRLKSDVVNRDESVDTAACRRIDTIARGWRRQLGISGKNRNPEEAGNLLAYAYPDRLARRRHPGGEEYLLSGGRAAVLPPGDRMQASEYLVVTNLDGGRQGRIFLAEPVALAQLQKEHAELLDRRVSVFWDSSRARVVSHEQVTLGAVVIEERPLSDPPPEEVADAMIDGIREMGLEVLPWSKAARQLQARVNFLRARQPEEGWPNLDDVVLADELSWLEPYLIGIRSREELQKIDLSVIFKSILGWKKLEILERDAPEKILVPSGSNIRLLYEDGEQPILAVRIQEMYGLVRTPTVCGGKVAVLLHLLSPAHRPVQVTADLPGFWQNSYQEVKKELKGRYPKHFWPDDPLTAPAVRGVKPGRKKNSS